MANRRAGVLLFVVMAGVGASPAAQLQPGYLDPRPVLDAARKAIGADNLRCVTVAGTGYAGMVGQQRLNDKNVDWPRGEPLANYTRTMNWAAGTLKEEFDRKPGLNPASWKYGPGWLDGTPTQRNPHQTFMANGVHAWHMDGTGSTPVPLPPLDAERAQLELWLNPHGFLKAAMMPGANPKATWRWELGEMGRDGPTTAPEKVTVVSITVMGKYRVDATINKENMLQRIHTWVPDPVLGDMNYEHEFTNASYVDVGGGVRFPTELAQPSRMGRQLPGPEHQQRPQRLWRRLQGHQAECVRRPGDRSRRGAAGDLSGPRGRREAGGRGVPAGRRLAQQRRRRVPRFRGRRGSAARRAAEPGGHRGNRAGSSPTSGSGSW